MIVDPEWLPLAGGICAAVGITHILFSASFYCREDPAILPGISLIVAGAAMAVSGLVPGLAGVAGAALFIFGAITAGYAVLVMGGFFGCSFDHGWWDFAVRLGIGIALVLLGGDLMGAVDAPTAVTNLTCHWENTSTSTAWVCPR